MGYPVQAGAPQCIVQGRTFAVGALNQSFGPMGSPYVIAIYERDAAQGWIESSPKFMFSDQVLLQVEAAGGIVKFIQWLIAQINAFFQKLFGQPPVPPGEPTTDDEAKAAITARVNALTLTVVSGVPVLG